MNTLVKYDKWCLSVVRATLLWVEEWLSISQRRIERVMIVTYLALALVDAGRGKTLYIVGPVLAYIGCLMWFMHRTPDAIRMVRERPNLAVARCFLQLWLMSVIAISFLISKSMIPHNPLHLVQQTDYALFFYVVSISTKGDPGRRRKLALSKIIEMFGTGWIPKPIGEPG